MANEQIVILDVGHGNCAVISDDRTSIVIDAGPKNALLEYLRENGIKRIDVILISHADTDHVAGLIGVLASGEVAVGHVRLNTDSLKGSDIWNDVLALLDRLDREQKVDFQIALVAGQGEFFSCSDVALEVLGPSKYLAGRGPGSTDNSERKITSNSISAVIRLVKGKAPIALLTGDLDSVGLANLIEDGVDLRAPTLIFPHHGGAPGEADAEAFAKELAQHVLPENVIFSIGRGRYRTPRPDILQALTDELPKIRFVCTQLSKHCAADLPDSSPSYVDQLFAVGRERQKCCGGSVIIDPLTGGILHPAVKEHTEFIESNARSAICMRSNAL